MRLLATYLKGPVGRPHGYSKLLRTRSRDAQCRPYLRRLTNTSWMHRLPALATSYVPSLFGQRYSIYYTTSAGMGFQLDLISPKLFTFTMFNLYWYLPKIRTVLTSIFLGFIYVNTRLRYIRNFLDQFPRYSRSSGADSLVLAKDAYQSRLIIILPSGKRKFFFILASAIKVFKRSDDALSYSTFSARKMNQRAGYSRLIGWRPTVRGVARNPVDHPHGGRTKTIKLPLTPWGLVAKKKH